MRVVPSIDIVVHDLPDTSAEAYRRGLQGPAYRPIGRFGCDGRWRWADAIRADLEAEGADPSSVNVSAGSLTSTAICGTSRSVNATHSPVSLAVASFQTLRLEVDRVASVLDSPAGAQVDNVAAVAEALAALSSAATDLVESMGGERPEVAMSADDLLVDAYRTGVLHGIQGQPKAVESRILEEASSVTTEAIRAAATEEESERAGVLAGHSLARLQTANRAIGKVYQEDLEILLAHKTTPADKVGLIRDYLREKFPRVVDEVAAKISKAHG